MRILLVILAALAVAGGTGFYVMQGLRSPELGRSPGRGAEAEGGVRSGAGDRRRHDHQPGPPRPDGDRRLGDHQPDGRGGRGGRSLPGRQRRPPGAAARRPDRPVGHRAAGRSGLPRRRAAARQAGGDDPDQRGRRPQRPRPPGRPRRHHPDLLRRRLGRLRPGGARQRDGARERSDARPRPAPRPDQARPREERQEVGRQSGRQDRDARGHPPGGRDHRARR